MHIYRDGLVIFPLNRTWFRAFQLQGITLWRQKGSACKAARIHDVGTGWRAWTPSRIGRVAVRVEDLSGDVVRNRNIRSTSRNQNMVVRPVIGFRLCRYGNIRIYFFLLERLNLFAICNNTFSKWWEGWRMSCRRVLSSTPLLVSVSETGGDSGE
jgi:hypothetical protein